MLTLARPDTFKNLQLNAGIFLVNFDYSAVKTKEQLIKAIETAVKDEKKILGATKGGGSFACTPTIRKIEVDGMRNAVVGSQVIDEWQVKLSTTLTELTPSNLEIAFTTGEATTSTDGITTLKIKSDLNNNDYVDKLCWIGDLSDGRYILINITKALNTVGATLTFADKGEGSIPVEFTAHQEGIFSEYLPVEVIFLGTKATA